MKCPRCKADNRQGATACWQCCANLTEADAMAPVVAANAAATPMPASRLSAPAYATTGGPVEMPPAAGAPGPARAASARPIRSQGSPGKRLPVAPIIVGLLVLGGVGAGAFFFMKNKAGDPSKVVMDFFAAFGKQDMEAMAKCCTSASSSQFSGPQAQAAKGLLALIKIENVETLGTTFEGDTAKVRFKAKATFMGMGDPNPKEQTATLVKENGEWKLDAKSGMGLGGNPIGGQGAMGGFGKGFRR